MSDMESARRTKMVVKAKADRPIPPQVESELMPEDALPGSGEMVGDAPPPPPPPVRVDEKIMEPGKYEVRKDHTFEVSLNLKMIRERWIVMVGPGDGIESHKVVFRMWNYDEMVDLKKRATNFDPDKRVNLVDNDLLNQLKVQKFMVSWTLDKENPRLKLFHVQGVLTDEGWEAFKRLQPNILTYIIDEMNKVYEYNG